MDDGPSLSESIVMLIDALQAYISLMEDPFEVVELPPAVTAHLTKCQELLAELKKRQVDPTLWGLRCQSKPGDVTEPPSDSV